MYLSSNAVTSVRHGNHKPSLITLAANSQTAKLADNRAMYVQLIALKSLGSTAPKLLIMIFSREASQRLSRYGYSEISKAMYKFSKIKFSLLTKLNTKLIIQNTTIYMR